MTSKREFWAKPAPHTKVKSDIVFKYFQAWAKILGRRPRNLIYLDLFAGRGEYYNGELTTALRIVEAASKDAFLREHLVILLNDKERSHYENINEVIVRRQLAGKFRNMPITKNIEVNKFAPDLVSGIQSAPSFCFIDPFGFKGVTIALIGAALKEWGCECMIFFNTPAINRNIRQNQSTDHLKALFGNTQYHKIQEARQSENRPGKTIVMEFFRDACLNAGAKYFLPFRIVSEGKCYHLIFLTKEPLGFRIMKDVMAGFSILENGIPQYLYFEGREDACDQQCLDLCVPLSMPMLKTQLLREFGGTKRTVKEVVDIWNEKGYLYTSKNVKDALVLLESERKIDDMTPSEKKRRQGTFGDTRVVCFREG